MSYDPGEYIVQCVKLGGDALTLYGFSAVYGQEIDLLSDATPATLRASDFDTAENMCTDTGFELAAKIFSGDWRIVKTRRGAL